MKQISKISAILLALCLTCGSCLTAFAADRAFYSMARVDAQNSAVVDALTPRTADEIDPDGSWSYDTGANASGWGKWAYPLYAQQHLYIAANSTLVKLDLDGNKAAEVTLPADVLGGGYTGWLAYDNGMIFVPSGAELFAYDADTLTLLWKGATGLTAGTQSSCPIICHNGYLFSGTTNGSSGGGYYCFDTTDLDPDRSDEVKQPIWKIEGDAGEPTGFYWAGSCVIGNYLVIPCDNGKVYAIDLVASKTANGGTPVVTDTLYPDNKKTNIRNSVVYEESSKRIFFCTATGIHAAEFDSANGKFGKLETVPDVSVTASTTVLLYNGRLYATTDGITVVNTKTMQKIYSTGGYAISDTKTVSPQNLTLSIGYATKENGNTVYLYGNSNTSPNYQFVLQDSETATTGKLDLLNTVTENPNWSTSQVFVTPDGSLFLTNDSAYLYYLAGKPGKTIYPVEQKIAALDRTLTDQNQAEFLSVWQAYQTMDESDQALVKEELVELLTNLHDQYEQKINNTQTDDGNSNPPADVPSNPPQADENNPVTGESTTYAAVGILLLAGTVLGVSRKKVRK